MLRESNGVNNNKKDHQQVRSSDGEDDKWCRGRPLSSHATPKPDPKRQQQHLSPPTVDDRATWRTIGTRGKGDPKDVDVGIIVLPDVVF